MILNDRDIWRGAWISSFKTFYGRNKWGTRRHSPYHLIILISFYANFIVDLYSICKGKEGFFFVKKGFLYKSSNHWSNKFSTAHHWKRSDAAATTCVFCRMSLTHLHGSHCEEFTNSDQPSMAMRGENSRTRGLILLYKLAFFTKAVEWSPTMPIDVNFKWDEIASILFNCTSFTRCGFF